MNIQLISHLLCQAYLVQKLLQFTDDVDAPMSEGYMWVGIILGTNVIRIISDVTFWMTSMRTATRLRSGILSFVFKKIAKLRNLQDRSVGEVSCHGNRMEEGFDEKKKRKENMIHT